MNKQRNLKTSRLSNITVMLFLSTVEFSKFTIISKRSKNVFSDACLMHIEREMNRFVDDPIQKSDALDHLAIKYVSNMNLN